MGKKKNVQTKQGDGRESHGNLQWKLKYLGVLPHNSRWLQVCKLDNKEPSCASQSCSLGQPQVLKPNPGHDVFRNDSHLGSWQCKLHVQKWRKGVVFELAFQEHLLHLQK